MATRRTPEEIEAIVDHCIELEKNGGDILAYLWSENYLTPRATWFNFQREWLGRKRYEYTDGKPRKEKKMEKVRRIRLTDELREKAVNIAIGGGDPKKFIVELGSTDPQGTWSKIKAWCKENRPDLYRQIPAHTSKPGPKPKDQPPVVKISGPIVIETPEPCFSIHAGSSSLPDKDLYSSSSSEKYLCKIRSISFILELPFRIS